MTTKSSEFFQRSKYTIPGGVNSPVRAFKSVGSNPLFISHGKGSHITDIDDKTYIDYVGSWGPLILGHAYPPVIQALEEQLHKGISFGAPTTLECELTEQVRKMMPSIDMLRLVNSGTEATMSAIRLARAYTNKDTIIKFAGCYHGHAESFLVQAGSGVMTLGLPDSPGVPKDFTKHTLVAPYNDIEAVRSLLENNQDKVAAIIIEPIAGNMGMILPKPNFLQQLRSLCDQHGCLLIFDEVMTGFRVSPGGASELFHVDPDLITLGKVIGGGLPVGAYGGREDIMSLIAPLGNVYQAGTLSGNPLATTAGLTTLKILSQPQTFSQLTQKTTWIVNELKDLFEKASVPHQVNMAGAMFGFFLGVDSVYDFTTASKLNKDLFTNLFHALLQEGVYIAPSPFEALFMSLSHTDEDLEHTKQAFAKALPIALDAIHKSS